LYEELLGRLPELCDHPDRYQQLWAVEDETLRASEAVVRSGGVQIEEVPSLDLAVITLPENAPGGGGHRFACQWVTGLHPMAVNNVTERLGLLSMSGSSYEFTYRYESWVQYRSRRPRPRVDLRPLADELTADETSGGHWVFEGVETLTPRLYLRGAEESSLAPSPAWNPYVS
jgi:hypothetical protein